MNEKLVFVLGALALVLSSLPSSAEAQTERSEPTRVSAYFTLQGCCEAHVDDRDANFIDLSFDADLDPSFGFGLRAERRIMDFVALGGMFEMVAWELDLANDREFFIDADIFAKILFELELSPGMGLEVYGLFPFGFTAGFADFDSGGDDLTGFGINMGVLGGAMLLFESFGIFVELGFRHHSVWDEVDARDYHLGTNQVAFNVGGSVAF